MGTSGNVVNSIDKICFVLSFCIIPLILGSKFQDFIFPENAKQNARRNAKYNRRIVPIISSVCKRTLRPLCLVYAVL